MSLLAVSDVTIPYGRLTAVREGAQGRAVPRIGHTARSSTG